MVSKCWYIKVRCTQFTSMWILCLVDFPSQSLNIPSLSVLDCWDMGCGGPLVCSWQSGDRSRRAESWRPSRTACSPARDKAKLAQKDPSEPTVLASWYPTVTRSNSRLKSSPLWKFTSELILLWPDIFIYMIFLQKYIVLATYFANLTSYLG